MFIGWDLLGSGGYWRLLIYASVGLAYFKIIPTCWRLCMLRIEDIIVPCRVCWPSDRVYTEWQSDHGECKIRPTLAKLQL